MTRAPAGALFVGRPTWWLEARLHFHPQGQGGRKRAFGPLFILNDDLVQPRSGFGCVPLSVYRGLVVMRRAGCSGPGARWGGVAARGVLCGAGEGGAGGKGGRGGAALGAQPYAVFCMRREEPGTHEACCLCLLYRCIMHVTVVRACMHAYIHPHSSSYCCECCRCLCTDTHHVCQLCARTHFTHVHMCVHVCGCAFSGSTRTRRLKSLRTSWRGS